MISSRKIGIDSSKSLTSKESAEIFTAPSKSACVIEVGALLSGFFLLALASTLSASTLQLLYVSVSGQAHLLRYQLI